MTAECGVGARPARPRREALKAPRLQVLDLQAGLGKGCDPSIRIPDAPVRWKRAAASCWWPPGLGLRLGVGGSCGLRFREEQTQACLRGSQSGSGVRDSRRMLTCTRRHLGKMEGHTNWTSTHGLQAGPEGPTGAPGRSCPLLGSRASLFKD